MCLIRVWQVECLIIWQDFRWRNTSLWLQRWDQIWYEEWLRVFEQRRKAQNLLMITSAENERQREGWNVGQKNCFTFFKTKFVTRRLKLAPLAVTCFVGRSQCDQTWRNFAILGTFYVSLAILWGFIVYLQRFQNHFGTFLWYWVNFLCGKRPDVENIWSHWAWRPGGQRTCSLVCRSEFKSRWSNTRIAIGII